MGSGVESWMMLPSDDSSADDGADDAADEVGDDHGDDDDMSHTTVSICLAESEQSLSVNRARYLQDADVDDKSPSEQQMLCQVPESHHAGDASEAPDDAHGDGDDHGDDDDKSHTTRSLTLCLSERRRVWQMLPAFVNDFRQGRSASMPTPIDAIALKLTVSTQTAVMGHVPPPLRWREPDPPSIIMEPPKFMEHAGTQTDDIAETVPYVTSTSSQTEPRRADPQPPPRPAMARQARLAR